jgi:Holliday junction resolvase-like predicted endonuclease
MTEKQVQHAIKKFLHQMGFSVWDMSQPRATKQTAGFCDLVACGKGLVIFIEVKTEKGRQTVDQKCFQIEVTQNGGEYQLWRSVKDAWDFLESKGIVARADNA